jgi:Flp pilus assembly protein TadD
MKAREAVVCPKCGTLNRRIWPLCARCGESLEGAAEAPGEAEAPTEGAFGAGRRPISAVTLLALAGLVVAGIWAWRMATRPLPPGPNPAAFTMATVPTEPEASAKPAARGADAYRAGQRALADGDLEEALVRLAAAVAADPDNAEYHKRYADALWRSGDRDAALSEQAEASRLDPRLRLAHARMLVEAGRLEDARSEYEAALVETPGAVTVHQDLGRMLFRAGDYAGAVEHLQQAAAAQPWDPALQQELAYALDRTGDSERATAAYREILRLAPLATATRQHLSESLYGQGEKEEAIAVLREGVARQPQAPSLHRQLGRLLEMSGRRQEAVVAYKSYLQTAPKAPDRKEVAARIGVLEGREAE